MGSLPLAPVVILYCFATYFVCGIPFGLLITRRQGIDVRSVGSGNIGTTNVARAAGKGAAGLTLLFDAGKGFIAVALARPIIAALCFGGDTSVLEIGSKFDWVIGIVFVAAIFGHVFSPYLHFKGGKGIAVGFGSTLGLCAPVAFILLGVFLLFVIPTRYVSLGSCMAALSLPISTLILFGPTPGLLCILIAVAGLVIWAHRENVKRLLKGEESKFAFKKD